MVADSGIPFLAITLPSGLQTISPSLYEATLLDGASSWQRFRRIAVPLIAAMTSSTWLRPHPERRMEVINRQERLLLTKAEDFGDLVLRRGRAMSGVVLLRIEPARR